MPFVDVKINDKPFLSSEVGLVLKTMTISQSHAQAKEVTFPDGCKRKILKAGNLVPDNTTPKGILFQDVDLTNGDKPASVMVGGRVYESRILEIGTGKETLQGIGIIFDTLPTETVPTDTLS